MNRPGSARRRGAPAAVARLVLAAALTAALCGCGESADGDAERVSAEGSAAPADPAPDVLAASASSADGSDVQPAGSTRTSGDAAPTTVTPSTLTPTTPAPTTSTSALSTPTTVAPTVTTVPLTPEEQLAAAQRLLLAHGYDVGEVDGAIGPATAAALADFQTNHGLPPSGQLDPATFARLERSGGALGAVMPASVLVDLSDQQLSVFNRAGERVTSWPISTGAPGNETPTGSYAVQGRQRVGTAKDAETVHMDYFTVFNGNIGFHGIPWVGSREDRLWTPLGQYGVSHGCIRMEDTNAQYLYNFLADGAPVTVQD